jgi:hypothetical protein
MLEEGSRLEASGVTMTPMVRFPHNAWSDRHPGYQRLGMISGKIASQLILLGYAKTTIKDFDFGGFRWAVGVLLVGLVGVSRRAVHASRSPF